MDDSYRTELGERISAVYRAHIEFQDYRSSYPWLIGSLGNPNARIVFVGENPSLGQIQRVSDPMGKLATEEVQWSASRGDRLFRELLVKHGFKAGTIESHGGWHCYITNVIKEADYAQKWRRLPAAKQKAAAEAWSSVFAWELQRCRPMLVIALGKTVRGLLDHLMTCGMSLPRIETVQHYSYVAHRPRGKQGPMHPVRVQEYDDEFAAVARICRTMK